MRVCILARHRDLRLLPAGPECIIAATIVDYDRRHFTEMTRAEDKGTGYVCMCVCVEWPLGQNIVPSRMRVPVMYVCVCVLNGP